MDGSAKKYTNKIRRDNVSHPLYIPTLALLIHFYEVSVYFDIDPWVCYSYSTGPGIYGSKPTRVRGRFTLP